MPDDDPPRRWRELVVLAVAMVLSMSTWFSTAAVLPQLRAQWDLSQVAGSWLAIAVQLGFVFGALVSAIFTLADRLRPRRLVLLGTSGKAGVFDEPLVRAMAAATPRPVILPLSNPTANCEGTPQDLLRWSDGRALVATGSPFAPVELPGRRVVVSQANNVYVFPGVGLGALVAEARRVTDSMFTVAAETLATEVTPADLAGGALLPSLGRLRPITARIAAAVVREAQRAGVSGAAIPPSEVEARVAEAIWFPDYPRYVPA